MSRKYVPAKPKLRGAPRFTRIATSIRLRPCPDCFAAGSEPCHDGNGRPMTSHHPGRHRAALTASPA